MGVAIPNTEAFVVDDNGEPAPPETVGELAIRGPHVMQGYWNDPTATDEKLTRGRRPWERILLTGDLFRADKEGFLYFVGRKDDIIKTRGEKVAPREVEAALYTHPGVVEAVVVGIKDPILGEAIAAMVVPSGSDVDERTLIGHCARPPRGFHGAENCRAAPSVAQDRQRQGQSPAGQGRTGSVDERLLKEVLAIDAAAETDRIAAALRQQLRALRKRGLVLGLSGGIESSVSLALAVAAVGRDRVRGLLMPRPSPIRKASCWGGWSPIPTSRAGGARPQWRRACVPALQHLPLSRTSCRRHQPRILSLEEEEQTWKTERDPIANFARWLMDRKIADKPKLDAMAAELEGEMKKAVDFAVAAPYPVAAEVSEDVYA